MGLLYHEARHAPYRMQLDVLAGVAHPAGHCASVMLDRYAVFLRAALEKQRFAWADMTHVAITLQFNAQLGDPHLYMPCQGDLMLMTVALCTARGHQVIRSAVSRCFPCQPGRFVQSARER